jgi:hypothetical protein
MAFVLQYRSQTSYAQRGDFIGPLYLGVERMYGRKGGMSFVAGISCWHDTHDGIGLV